MCLLTIILSTSVIKYKEYKFKTLYEGMDSGISYSGTVVSIEGESEYYCNYIVKVKDICNGMQETNVDQKINIDKVNNNVQEANSTKRAGSNKNFNNSRILLRIKKHSGYEEKRFEYGDLIRGIGDFEKPSVMRNYKGYDYSQYLKTKNVYMICTSSQNSVQVLKKDSLFVVNMWISRLNNRLKLNIYTLLPTDKANIAIAFLLGDSGHIDVNQRETFSAASLLHVLAISGMHVTYVILGLSFLFRKVGKREGKYLDIVFLIFFAMLTGGSPSVVRAVVMSSIMISSKLFYRKSDTINNISIACLVLLIANPYNILNLGFQLSFLGTLGIVLFNSTRSMSFE